MRYDIREYLYGMDTHRMFVFATIVYEHFLTISRLRKTRGHPIDPTRKCTPSPPRLRFGLPSTSSCQCIRAVSAGVSLLLFCSTLFGLRFFFFFFFSKMLIFTFQPNSYSKSYVGREPPGVCFRPNALMCASCGVVDTVCETTLETLVLSRAHQLPKQIICR